MATTVQQVFDIAMALMDEVDEATGATDTPDTQGYRQRTLLILNELRGELYPYSASAVFAAGTRPMPAAIQSFTAPLPLDDFLAQSVMPYGLAAHLLLQEDPGAASFFQQRYEQLLARYGCRTPVESEDIMDIYGIRGGAGDEGD